MKIDDKQLKEELRKMNINEQLSLTKKVKTKLGKFDMCHTGLLECMKYDVSVRKTSKEDKEIMDKHHHIVMWRDLLAKSVPEISRLLVMRRMKFSKYCLNIEKMTFVLSMGKCFFVTNKNNELITCRYGLDYMMHHGGDIGNAEKLRLKISVDNGKRAHRKFIKDWTVETTKRHLITIAILVNEEWTFREDNVQTLKRMLDTDFAGQVERSNLDTFDNARQTARTLK
eukprot:UN26207